MLATTVDVLAVAWGDDGVVDGGGDGFAEGGLLIDCRDGICSGGSNDGPGGPCGPGDSDTCVGACGCAGCVACVRCGGGSDSEGGDGEAGGNGSSDSGTRVATAGSKDSSYPLAAGAVPAQPHDPLFGMAYDDLLTYCEEHPDPKLLSWVVPPGK